MGKRLGKEFFMRDTTRVARELLGKRLVHIVQGHSNNRTSANRATNNTDSRIRLAGTIVETEAYLGAGDRACHSFGALRTKRTESLFLEGGTSYVFLIYGMHCCFNVVTRDADKPEAVLIRAIQPTEGIEEMLRRRLLRDQNPINLSNGPGKLCEALGIDRSCDRVSLMKSPSLFLEDAPMIEAQKILASARIGVDYAGEAASWPLRFSIVGNSYVSKTQKSKKKS